MSIVVNRLSFVHTELPEQTYSVDKQLETFLGTLIVVGLRVISVQQTHVEYEEGKTDADNNPVIKQAEFLIITGKILTIS